MNHSRPPIFRDIPPKAHLCLFYEGEHDWAKALEEYFRSGIEGAQPCLLLHSPSPDTPNAKSPDFPASIEVWGLPPQETDPPDLPPRLRTWIESAIDGGKKSARIAVDMARFADASDAHKAPEIEQTLREFAKEYPVIILCGYPLDRCPSGRLLHLIHSHAFAVIRADRSWQTIRALPEGTAPAHPYGEHFFQTLIEGAHDMVVVLDAEGKIQYASPSLERIGGYDPGELVGKKGFDFVHPDDLPQALGTFSEGIQTPGYKTSIQVRLRRKNGAWRWVELRGRNLLHDPTVQGAVLNFIDIHDMKTAMEALAESEERFRIIFENANDQIVYVDDTGTITNVNPKVMDIFGLKREEVIGKLFTEIPFTSPAELQQIAEGFQKMLRGEAESARVEITGYHRNGEKILIETNARVVRTPSGKQGIIVIVRDMTRHKMAQEALRASEEKWRSLVESAPNIVMTTTCDGTILFVNRTVTGITPADVVGKSIYDFVKPEHHAIVRQTIEKVIRTGLPATYEIIGLGPNGRDAWYETHIGPIKPDGEVTALTFVNTDITERKRAEEALRESEQKFRGIFENATDMLLYLDSSGIILDVNGRCKEIFGYTREELIGKRFITFPTLRATVMWEIIDRFNKVMHSDTSDTITFEAVRKDGETVFLEASARTVRIGAHTGLLAVIRNITERKRAELALQQAYDEMEARVEERTAQLARSNAELESEIAERKKMEAALRLSEAKYRLVAENTSDFIAVTSPDGIYMYVSPSYRNLGHDPEKLIGTPGMDLVHPDDREQLSSTVRGLIRRWRTEKAGTSPPMFTANLEYRVRDTSGNWHIFETTTNYVPRPNAQPIMVHVSRDVTERRQAAQALRESEEKFKTIFENANDEIIYLDEHGRVIDRNIKGPDVVGLTFEEVKGKGLDELGFVVPPDKLPSLVQMYDHILETGSRGSTQVEMIHKEGHTVIVEASASALRKGDRLAGVVIILRDITDRKRAELSLQRYAAELREMNEELSQYAQVASHDICAPLRAIRYYTHLLRRELGEATVLDPKGYLDTIDKAVVEGEELAERLLELARIGQTGLQTERFNVGTLLRKVIASMGPQADVEISMRGRWPTIESDPLLLRQVFQNLIDNAIKFNHSAQKRVELGWRAGKHEHEFYVKDNGIGIPQRDQERIFNVFERLHHREEYKGTGIGLAIVKKAVTRLGGSVRVESSPGYGSTFYVTVPKSARGLP